MYCIFRKYRSWIVPGSSLVGIPLMLQPSTTICAMGLGNCAEAASASSAKWVHAMILHRPSFIAVPLGVFLLLGILFVRVIIWSAMCEGINGPHFFKIVLLHCIFMFFQQLTEICHLGQQHLTRIWSFAFVAATYRLDCTQHQSCGCKDNLPSGCSKERIP